MCVGEEVSYDEAATPFTGLSVRSFHWIANENIFDSDGQSWNHVQKTGIVVFKD